MGWTPATSPRDTAAIINKALATALETGAAYIDNAPRTIAGTIRLGGKLVMEFGSNHRWQADTSDLTAFDPIAGSTKRVFVDNAGARGSIIRGPFHLLGVVPRSMNLVGRQTIPADLVAWSASHRAESSEITMEALTVEGFGHAFYQPPRTDRLVLPYTRLNCGTAVFRFCRAPILTEGTNGLDDMVLTILRMSRNAGRSIIRGTDLNAVSMFNYGLNLDKDAEPGRVRLRKGSRTVEGAAPGMVIAVPGFAGMVGRDGQLQEPSLVDYAGPYVANPPSLVLRNSSLTALHGYVEGLHDYPIALGHRSRLSCRDFKVSRGKFSGRGGYAVSRLGEGTSVDVQLNPRSVDNPFVRAVVEPE